jgi:hypothetical protein
MPNAFKNAKKKLQTTAGTAVYTCPASTVAIIVGCQVSNVTATEDQIDVWWTDDSDADAVTRLISEVVLPIRASLLPIGGKLVLEAGDTIVARGLANDRSEITVSVLEIS